MGKDLEKQVQHLDSNTLFIRGQHLLQILVKRIIQLTSFSIQCCYLRSWNYNTNNNAMKQIS